MQTWIVQLLQLDPVRLEDMNSCRIGSNCGSAILMLLLPNLSASCDLLVERANAIIEGLNRSLQLRLVGERVFHVLVLRLIS